MTPPNWARTPEADRENRLSTPPGLPVETAQAKRAPMTAAVREVMVDTWSECLKAAK